MTVLNYFETLHYTSEETEFYNEVFELTNSFCNTVALLNDTDEMLFEFKLFNLKYGALNDRFKILTGANPKSKTNALYPRTFKNTITLKRALEIHGYKIQQSGSEKSYSNKKYEFVKFKFTEPILRCIFRHILYFIVAGNKTKRPGFAQLYICYILALIEFFYPSDLDFNTAIIFFNQFLNMEVDEVVESCSYLQANFKEIVNKRAETNTGLKHTVHKRNRNRKCIIPESEIKEVLEAKSKTEKKKTLAEKYNISVRSVERIINDFNKKTNK